LQASGIVIDDHNTIGLSAFHIKQVSGLIIGGVPLLKRVYDFGKRLKYDNDTTNGGKIKRQETKADTSFIREVLCRSFGSTKPTSPDKHPVSFND
jgi:hypothetical protein